MTDENRRNVAFQKSISASAFTVGIVFLTMWLHLSDSRHVGTVTEHSSQGVVVIVAIPICLDAFYVTKDAVLTVCCTSVCKVSK